MERIATKYGTPAYVIDQVGLRASASRFLQAFRAVHPRTRVCYSYKTNPLRAVCRFLTGLGYGADVATAHELVCAGRVGVPGSDIVFNGPAKADRDMALAMSVGALVVLDGPNELERAASLARRHRGGARLGLRYSTCYDGGEIGGRDWKFGLDSGQMEAAIRRLEELGLEVECLHFHLGTDVRSAAPFVDAVRELGEVARRAGLAPRVVDVGGAFATGVNPPLGQTVGSAEPIEEVARQVGAAVRTAFSSDTELFVEPGRAVVEGSTTFLCRVLEVKERATALVAIADGGVNLVPSATYLRHRVEHLPSGGATVAEIEPDPVDVALFGPLCMSIDLVSDLRLAEPPKVGDLLAVCDVGAYNYAESWAFGRGRPPVVWLGPDGSIELARDPEDVGALDHLEHAEVADRDQ